MNSSSRMRQLLLATCAVLLLQSVNALAAQAQSTRLKFQRPSSARSQNTRVNKAFRRPIAEKAERSQPAAKQAPATKTQKPKTSTKTRATKQQEVVDLDIEPIFPAEEIEQPPVAKVARQKKRNAKRVRRDPQVAIASSGPVLYDRELTADLRLASHGCDICEGPCMCDPGCGLAEPSCGLYEPGCGIVEPTCGCNEPSCGICDPGCGIAEPSCGCGDVGCGSCVARPGPDYWCFPICLPRFKDMTLSAGVQGFRGPRDFSMGRSDSNFGFNESINISGRAPLVGLLFPQLSYQLGYRAVQSRLYGTTTSTEDRSQQFVTAGFFRRVNTGLQFGLVWDLMEDNLDTNIDLHQLRGEISIKSPRGRELGFLFTSSTNDSLSLGTLYETVDQYAFFYRCTFGNNYEGRLWGGFTGESDGLFGGEFFAPLNNRWSVQTGFNFLIPDENAGLPGVSEESWNVGVNLVWHLGKTARKGCRSPYRPLFSVADNGWMFVDQVQ